MQMITIIGNLTRAPETRQVGDKSVCNFTVAVNRKKKPDGTQEADFFRVSAWGKTGEPCQKYLDKGKKVCVVGTVSAHAYAGQDGTPQASLEVFAQNVEFLSGNGGNGAGAAEGGTDVTAEVQGDLPF